MTEPTTVDLWALSDLCTPWCIHVAATLRIANYIHEGIDGVGELAKEAGCDAGVLHAVLGHLARKGIFDRVGAGRFALNETSRQLLDPVTQMSLNLDGIGGRFAHAWGTLLKFTRTGEPAYADLFGRPFWEDLAAHPEIAADFDALIGPAGHGTPNPAFEIMGGWDKIQTVVDVGGGTGAMLAEILKARPHLRGILVDQPGTVSRSGEIFASAGVNERVSTSGQSFFDPLPAGMDLYLLRGILNDFPDREAAMILARCVEAAHPNSKVVVLKGVVEDDEPKDMLIEMVLLGGKLRTVSEMGALGRQVGLEIVSAGQQPSGYFVVEYRLT